MEKPGRIEMKFLLTPEAYLHLRESLKFYSDRDPHSQSTGKYPVFSQYYDTEDLTYFYDKINGEHEHIKVRVRRYTNDFDDGSLSFLEAKIKYNNWQKKIRIKDQSATLGEPETWAGIEGDDGFFEMRNRESPHFPVCNVYYEREAFFLYDGPEKIRFNFDTDILFLYKNENKISQDLFVDRQMLKEYACVFEVKTRYERLPVQLQRELRHVGASLTTFSKYTTCLVRLDEWNRHNEVHI